MQVLTPKRVVIQRWKIGAGGFIGEVTLFQLTDDDAWVRAYSDHHVVELSNLHVHPLRRRHGWGSVLVRTALAEAARKDFSVFIRVIPYNGAPMSADELIVFYRRYGFRQLHRGDRTALIWHATHR